jgi:glutathione peroxidase-family protein
MKPGDNIEESVTKLRHTTSSETDERILSDALAALQESTQSRRPVAVKSAIATLVAAVIIIVVFIGFEVSTIPPQKQPQSLTQKQAPAPEAAVETMKEPEQDLVVKPEPEPAIEKSEAELKEIERLFTAGDIDGLASMLSEKPLASQLAVAVYLAEIGDLRALEALEKLSSALGGDDPNNLFSITAAGIKDRAVQEKEKPAHEEKYIDGWLIDANGNPIQGEIQLGRLKVKTEADGAFTIREPNDTEFGSVFGRALDVNGSLGRFFIWDKDNDTNDAEIMVEPLASVSGFVADSNNNAVSDFRLKISVFATEDTVYQGSIGEEPWQTQINKDGFFDINSILTGVRLRLAVEKPGFKTLINLDSLVAGDNLDLGQITLEPMHGLSEDTQWNCSLAGFVVDENNEPVSEARIGTVVAKRRFEVITDANGWYELRDLPNGVETEIATYFDGYGYNLLAYTCSEPNGRLDIQIFPPAYDWYDKPAPGLFVKKWFNTEPITLDELKGNVVLLYVGVQSSEHVRFVQELNEIYSRYKEKPLALIAIHKDPNACGITEDEIKQFIEENNIEFAFGIDEEMHVVEDMMPPRERLLQKERITVSRGGLRREGAMYSLYEVKAEPAYYLIDKNGLLQASPSPETLERWIEHLLEEQPAFEGKPGF